MPRTRRVTTRTAPGTVTVTMTVTTVVGLFVDGRPSFVGCVAVEGTRSPVTVGPRAAVLRSLTRWLSTAERIPEVRIHRPETEEAAEDDGDAVTRAFHETGLGSVHEPPLYRGSRDPAGARRRPGHVSPDVIVVRVRSGNKLKAPRAWPVPPPTAPAPEDQSTNPVSVSFNRRLARVRKKWSSTTSRLLCSRVPETEQRPRMVNVYTDASTSPGSSFAAIGLVCPELSIVASGVLPRAWSRQNLNISAGEPAGVAAAVQLFGEFADTVMIHSDSVAAVAWWRNPLRVPGWQLWIKASVVAVQREVERNGSTAGARWVKGHADTDTNLWADRAAKLSWRSASWGEPEGTRSAKFAGLVEEVADHYSGQDVRLSDSTRRPGRSACSPWHGGIRYASM